METRDTHGWVAAYDNHHYKELNLKGDITQSESAKFSNRKHIEVTGFEIGPSKEDAIDLVRGSDIAFKNGILNGDGSKQTATVKAGISNLVFENVAFIGKPKIAHVVIGQYSDYNFKKSFPKTNTIRFINCEFDPNARAVQIWYGNTPEFIDCDGVSVQRIHPLIVQAYYTFRRIQQRIVHGKRGRNNVLDRI